MGLALSDMLPLSLGTVLDLLITYSNMIGDSEQSQNNNGIRQATQSDIDALAM